MDLIESVRVSLFLGRISGVCPITVNGPKFQRHITISKFYLLWSVFIIILQLFVFYFSVSKPYDSTLLAFIYTFNNFNTNLSQIIITICLLLKRDCLIDILEKLNKYSDVNLKKIFILITFIGPLFCIFIFTIYFVNTLITWNKYGSDLYTIEEITFEIVLILYELILFEIVTFYVSLIYFIYLNLKRLNDEFEMFQELNGTSIKRIRHVPNEITKFSSRFFYLRELADQVSYLFSILALLSISLNFVFIVAILFVIISEYFRGNDKEGNLSLLLSWVFYLVTKSVLICGVPSLVSDEVKFYTFFFNFNITYKIFCTLKYKHF